MNILANSIQEINNAHILLELRKCIDKQIELNYERKENFMLHEELDEYLYIIHYTDGHTYIAQTGKKAYDMYINDDSAISIERKTKNLFPTYELLIKKEHTH